MYRLLSPQTIVDNVVALSKNFIKSGETVDLASIKKAYRQYLLSIQPHCPYTMNETLFHANIETERAFADYFLKEQIEFKNPKLQVDVNQVMYPDALTRQSALENSLKEVATKDPIFADLFKLVMNTVFCTSTQSLGGTSVNPRYIGVMCAHYDMNAEPAAIPELFIHEFTHQVLFLDELRYKHFDYQIMEDPNTHIDIDYEDHQFKLSAHRCLHSLVVAAEVLLARNNYIGHTELISQHLPTEALVHRANIYLNQMQKNAFTETILTQRGKQLFAACEAFYAGYQIH